MHKEIEKQRQCAASVIAIIICAQAKPQQKRFKSMTKMKTQGRDDPRSWPKVNQKEGEGQKVQSNKRQEQKMFAKEDDFVFRQTLGP